MGYLQAAEPSGGKIVLIHGPKSNKYRDLPPMPPEVMEALETYSRAHLKNVHKREISEIWREK